MRYQHVESTLICVNMQLRDGMAKFFIVAETVPVWAYHIMGSLLKGLLKNGIHDRFQQLMHVGKSVSVHQKGLIWRKCSVTCIHKQIKGHFWSFLACYILIVHDHLLLCLCFTSQCFNRYNYSFTIGPPPSTLNLGTRRTLCHLHKDARLLCCLKWGEVSFTSSNNWDLNSLVVWLVILFTLKW